MPSNPTTPDRDRTGADLIARIDELTTTTCYEGMTVNGWRPLLTACKGEIERLRESIETLQRAHKTARQDRNVALRWMQAFERVAALVGIEHGKLDCNPEYDRGGVLLRMRARHETRHGVADMPGMRCVRRVIGGFNLLAP